VSFVAAVQTTRNGHPQFACFALQPFATEGVGAFAAKSLAPSDTFGSFGLMHRACSLESRFQQIVHRIALLELHEPRGCRALQ